MIAIKRGTEISDNNKCLQPLFVAGNFLRNCLRVGVPCHATGSLACVYKFLLLMCFRLCKNKCIGWIQPYYIRSGFWFDIIFSFFCYKNCSTKCFFCAQYPCFLKRLRWSRGSVLAFGIRVREFKPDRSRRIFQGEKKSSALPSEGKLKRLSHVVDLRHVKDPWMSRGSRAFFRQNSSGHFSPT